MSVVIAWWSCECYDLQGDRVIVGGDHYFRFNHPNEVAEGRNSLTKHTRDFEFARQELIRVQNER